MSDDWCVTVYLVTTSHHSEELAAKSPNTASASRIRRRRGWFRLSAGDAPLRLPSENPQSPSSQQRNGFRPLGQGSKLLAFFHQLPFLKDVANMQADVLLGRLKQIDHLRLAKPDGFASPTVETLTRIGDALKVPAWMILRKAEKAGNIKKQGRGA